MLLGLKDNIGTLVYEQSTQQCHLYQMTKVQMRTHLQPENGIDVFSVFFEVSILCNVFFLYFSDFSHYITFSTLVHFSMCQKYKSRPMQLRIFCCCLWAALRCTCSQISSYPSAVFFLTWIDHSVVPIPSFRARKKFGGIIWALF